LVTGVQTCALPLARAASAGSSFICSCISCACVKSAFMSKLTALASFRSRPAEPGSAKGCRRRRHPALRARAQHCALRPCTAGDDSGTRRTSCGALQLGDRDARDLAERKLEEALALLPERARVAGGEKAVRPLTARVVV